MNKMAIHAHVIFRITTIYNNYLPITGYDETTWIQFVNRFMFTQTKRTKSHTKKKIQKKGFKDRFV